MLKRSLNNMANENDTNPALRLYLSDLASLDKHILEALVRQDEDERVKNDPEASKLVRESRQLFERFSTELHEQCERVGTPIAKAVKESVTGVLGVAAGLYDKVRKDPVSRMLRDDYVAFNLAAISYNMMHTTGLAVHDQPVADIAKRHLEELTKVIMEINQIMPHIVVRELQDEPGIDSSVAHEAVQHTQEVWKPK